MRKIFLSFMMVLAMSSQSFAESYERLAIAAVGYDVVAYFTERKATKGDSNHVVYNDGLAYLFQTKENADLFKEKPRKYKPAYNGYCAMGVSKGRKVAVDPEAWKIVNGKLYLNLNQTVQNYWLEDMEGNIEAADEFWPEIKGVHPNKL